MVPRCRFQAVAEDGAQHPRQGRPVYEHGTNAVASTRIADLCRTLEMTPNDLFTRIIVEIVAKSPDQIGFAVLPRRWVVERFFAWIGRNRRLAKDFEASIDSARAFLYAASVMLLSRRIARHA